MAGRAPDVGVGDALKVGHVRDADDAADHDRARKAQHVRQQLAQERLLRHLAGCTQPQGRVPTLASSTCYAVKLQREQHQVMVFICSPPRLGITHPFSAAFLSNASGNIMYKSRNMRIW